MPRTSREFQTPPEVIDYFAQKSLRPAFSWLDVWGQEHAQAFTVAKATETELLGVFQKSINEANEKGEGIEAWKKRLEPELKRLGWWGPRMVSDPLGKDVARAVDFSSPRRLKTIFDANMRSARAAGQWQRIQRAKRGMPYILYVRTVSTDARPEHVAFVGTILPVDHEFWRTHFPPNGWGCKCSVRSITAREAMRLGYDPEAGGPQIVFRKFRNRRTGEESLVPEGIDPGWQTNPGLSRAKTLTDSFAQRLHEAGPEIATKQIADFWQSPERKMLADLKEPNLSMPVGVSSSLASDLGSNGKLVSVFADTSRQKRGKDQEGQTRGQAFDRLNQVIAQGTIINEGNKDARTMVWHDGQRWWSAVIQKAATGFLRVITFHQESSKRAERMLKKGD